MRVAQFAIDSALLLRFLRIHKEASNMHKLLFLIAFVLALYGVARAQNFEYTVATDSVAWNALSSQTILNSGNSAWNFSYRIPIGFTFSFLGRSFDTLTIETNGYLVFGDNRNYAITAFSGVGDRTDSNGIHSVLGYELSGSAGNRVLKIQYLNCSPGPSGGDDLSWQIWLRENGNAEVRVGPGTLRTNTEITFVYDEEMLVTDTLITQVLDSTQLYRIGLLNMNMDTEVSGFFVVGDPSDPEPYPLNWNDTETPLLLFIPAQGYRYTFSPAN
jgi:hypothetical protein